MRKKTKKMKKGMAYLMTLLLTLGVVQTMPGTTLVVNAATSSKPSVTTYATKQELMESFKQDGTNDTIGKLVFGKEGPITPMEWYILGADKSIGDGNNITVFATSPIITNQVFEDDNGTEKTYQPTYGVYASAPAKLNPNHYGASDLRVALQEVATDTNHFSKAEQALMQATPVTTYDNKNSENYTTTDILYVPDSTYSNTYVDYILAGSTNDKKLYKKNYWMTGDQFWLRSPYLPYSAYEALLVDGEQDVYHEDVAMKTDYDVRPVTNIKLTSVLFASSAPARLSTPARAEALPSNKAMRLRFDGSNIAIGNVICDSEKGELLATKSPDATGTVSLIVQGNDGTNNWFYSEMITDSKQLKVSEIKEALSEVISADSDIDLSKCCIWLETTLDDGLKYANMATEKTMTKISKVELSGIDIPTPKKALDTEAVTNTAGISDATPSVTWKAGDKVATGNADYNTAYTASVTLGIEDTYIWGTDITATVNGQTASVTKNGDNTITVSYAFPAVKDKLISITAPESVTVANGTAYADMKLPTTVAIVTEGSTVTTANVAWNTTTPSSGSYDPSVTTEQKVTLTGTVTCPDTIDANGVSLSTSITIIINAASSEANNNNVNDNNTKMSDDGKATYNITASSAKNKAVTYVAPANKKLSKVTIPDTVVIDGVEYKVTEIKKNAFKNNKYIKTVTIGKNVKTIGASAFSGCSKLKTLKLGSSVTTISDKAFYKCTKLTKITIPSKVNKIGKQAFYGCKKLKNITIKTTKLTSKKVGSKAFTGTQKEAKVKVPKKSLTAYKKFLYKKGLNKKAKITK